MNPTGLSSIQKKYKGLWVALTDDLEKVVAANKDAQVTYNKAVEKGYKKPTLFKVPENITPYVGFNGT